MLELLKEMIIDGQGGVLFSGVSRNRSKIFINGKATVCIGVHRSGKSTFMIQRMQQLIKYNGTGMKLN